MLTKLFAHHEKCRSRRKEAPPPPPPPETPANSTMPLRIIHAGGMVECYYMAVPAVVIMAKYPRAVLAWPDVFHRPWDSLVLPEDILKPGEKIYIVPRRTVRKLRSGLRLPAARLPSASESDFSDNSSNTIGWSKNHEITRADKERNTRSTAKNGLSKEGSSKEKPVAPPRPPRSRRVRPRDPWQPSLVAIHETSP